MRKLKAVLAIAGLSAALGFADSAAELKGPGAKETNNDLTYGAGLQYDLTRQVGVRGEWQRYNKMGGGSIAETNVDVLSVGVVYRFQ